MIQLIRERAEKSTRNGEKQAKLMIADCFCITAEIEGEQIMRSRCMKTVIITPQKYIPCSPIDFFPWFGFFALIFIEEREEKREKQRSRCMNR